MPEQLFFLAVTFTFVVLVLVFAWAARRLLGLRIGLVRTVLAGLVGYAVSALAGPLVPREQPAAFFTIALGIALLATMAFLLVAEFFVPSGRWPGPVAALRALTRWLTRIRRYVQISRIAVRHGLGPYLHGSRRAGPSTSRARLARSLRLALQEGGVTFVKLGQLLSTRADLLPPEFVTELARLQDQVPPAPWPQIEQLLQDELRAPLAEEFARFDHEPLAAASIAQVHTAQLREGAEVVVKVQRPGVRPVVDSDLDIIARISATLRARTGWGRTIGVDELAEGLAAALREELDFRVEAGNIDALTAASATGGDDTGVQLPVRHAQLCTERILVLDRLDGVPLAAADHVIDDLRLDRTELARTLLGTVLRQILTHGVFHADPHPGNVFLLADGRLALLDFGSVGRIDPALRATLHELLLAIDRGDPAALRDTLLELLVRPEDVDEVRLERALGRFMARHLGPGGGDLTMFTDMFRLIARHNLAVPPEAAAVFRALGTLEGTLSQLAPGFDLVSEARRFAAGELFATQLRPDTLRHTLVDELTAILPILRRLPRRLDRITGALEQGRLGVNVRLFADERGRRQLNGVLNQVLLTVVGAVAGIMAALLLGTTGGPVVAPQVTLLQLFGYNLLLISCVIGLRLLVVVSRR